MLLTQRNPLPSVPAVEISCVDLPFLFPFCWPSKASPYGTLGLYLREDGDDGRETSICNSICMYVSVYVYTCRESHALRACAGVVSLYVHLDHGVYIQRPV